MTGILCGHRAGRLIYEEAELMACLLYTSYRQVLADRVAGNISEEAYRMVYGLCIELAYPRK